MCLPSIVLARVDGHSILKGGKRLVKVFSEPVLVTKKSVGIAEPGGNLQMEREVSYERMEWTPIKI